MRIFKKFYLQGRKLQQLQFHQYHYIFAVAGLNHLYELMGIQHKLVSCLLGEGWIQSNLISFENLERE